MTDKNQNTQSEVFQASIVFTVSLNDTLYVLPIHNLLNGTLTSTLTHGKESKDLSESELQYVAWIKDSSQDKASNKCDVVSRYLLKQVLLATKNDQDFRKKFGITGGIDDNHITERGLLICNAIKVNDFGVDRLNSLVKFLSANIIVLSVSDNKGTTKTITEVK